MHRTTPTARTPGRRTYLLAVAGLAVVIAAITWVVCSWSPESSTASTASAHMSRQGHHGPPGAADGVVPDGVTVFDDTTPAVTRLDPDLLKALRRAATAAADDGLAFHVNSGWRSPSYQNRLLREAVAKYGSEDEAARWVATAETSPHVSGDAVDLGRSAATAWLSEHGAEHGLCQIYENEPWHYELRPEATDHGCPRRYADPTQDPRTRQ
ncbi:M15 family metallopeptidase [Streptomyces sp. AN091965]|uniref:M15 family metallopeptidase n=1 Tax=Streptomyces sp. AN091965 TaxID=2927803 RepID=UPI001F61AF2A|nr:M15 family metallopeptidase [Streptomyces sp. AN091965]MCI3928753.1 M15 family metallopeptidase [Streptomyces sp. AN091965]